MTEKGVKIETSGKIGVGEFPTQLLTFIVLMVDYVDK
jgi:hypothetical protein